MPRDRGDGTWSRLGLPDDLVETVLAHQPGPSSDERARIREQVRVRVQDPQRSVNGRYWAALAVLLAGLLLWAKPWTRSTLRVVPAALTTRVLRVVPGLGVESPGRDAFALPHPQAVTVGVGTIWVGGVYATNLGTTVALSGTLSTWHHAIPLLRGERGTRYRPVSFNAVSTIAHWGIWPASLAIVTYPPLPSSVRRHLQLAFPAPHRGDWRGAQMVSLSLVPARDLPTVAAFGPRRRIHGIVVAARVEPVHRGVALSVLVTGPSVASSCPTLGSLTLLLPGGRSRTIWPGVSLCGVMTQIMLPVLPHTTGTWGLDVSSVTLTTNARGTVSLPVPRLGGAMVRRLLRVGPLKLVATSVRRLPGRRIEVGLRTGPGESWGGSFLTVAVNGIQLSSWSVRWSSNRQVGVLAFKLPEGVTTIRLTVHGAKLLVVGPWRLSGPFRHR